MSVFHVPSVCANANARAVDALERLCEHIDTFRTRPLVGEEKWTPRIGQCGK